MDTVEQGLVSNLAYLFEEASPIIGCGDPRCPALLGEAFRTASQLEQPENIEEAAVTFFNLGRYDHFVTLMDKVIEKDPENAVFHYNFGSSLSELSHRRHEKGRRHLEEACRLDPANEKYQEELKLLCKQMAEREHRRRRAQECAAHQTGSSYEI